MSKIELEKWIAENGTKKECEYFNGIRYAFVTMKDGWIAIFECKGNGEYVPMIQAADIEHARSYCEISEPVRVPINIL